MRDVSCVMCRDMVCRDTVCRDTVCRDVACRDMVWCGTSPILWRGAASYVSYDFRIHPMGFLTLGLLVRHRRDRVHVLCYHYGPGVAASAHSAHPHAAIINMTSRIASACDTFVHAADMTPADIAASIRDAGAHVVVDLMGHTMGARVGIVAAKPAPIVVNYLGCPCSSGGDTTDYVMVDAVVAPLEERGAFSEARVYVCYVSVCVECVYCGRVLCGSVSEVLDPALCVGCLLLLLVCLCVLTRCVAVQVPPSHLPSQLLPRQCTTVRTYPGRQLRDAASVRGCAPTHTHTHHKAKKKKSPRGMRLLCFGCTFGITYHATHCAPAWLCVCVCGVCGVCVVCVCVAPFGLTPLTFGMRVVGGTAAVSHGDLHVMLGGRFRTHTVTQASLRVANHARHGCGGVLQHVGQDPAPHLWRVDAHPPGHARHSVVAAAAVQ